MLSSWYVINGWKSPHNWFAHKFMCLCSQRGNDSWPLEWFLLRNWVIWNRIFCGRSQVHCRPLNNFLSKCLVADNCCRIFEYLATNTSHVFCWPSKRAPCQSNIWEFYIRVQKVKNKMLTSISMREPLIADSIKVYLTLLEKILPWHHDMTNYVSPLMTLTFILVFNKTFGENSNVSTTLCSREFGCFYCVEWIHLFTGKRLRFWFMTLGSRINVT